MHDNLTHSTNSNGASLVFSYLALRKTIGVLGMAFPFILVLGNLLVFHGEFQAALSSYYHTSMRDVFVGILFVVGFFMFSYKGYSKADDWAGDLTCLFALGVALFPTSADCSSLGPCPSALVGNLHVLFAILYFSTLAYFCLVLFTKTKPGCTPTPNKLKRNKIYRICGWVMVLTMVLMASYMTYTRLAGATRFDGYFPIFWLETLANLAFGFSWLVKGEAILQDVIE